jgi:hypothetical protein
VTDLQRLLPHDHALDQQLQERLFLLEARPVQPAADSLAECREVAQDPLSVGRLSNQPQLLLVLLSQNETALGESATTLIQLLKTDDRRLVGIDEPFGLAVQSPELGLELVGFGLLARVPAFGVLGHVSELGEHGFRVAEELLDMAPDRLLKEVRRCHLLRTTLFAGAARAVLATAPVVARARPAWGDAEHPEATGLARQQAAQQVGVPCVVAKRQSGVPFQLVLGSAIRLLVDEGRHGDPDPLLPRAALPARVLASSGGTRPWLLGRDEAIPVGVGHSGVGLIVKDPVYDGRLPGVSTRAWPPGTFVQSFDDLADRHPLLDQPGEELAHQHGFVLLDHQITRNSVTLWNVSISIRRPAAEPVALAGLLKLAATEPLANDGSLVFGHGSLDLEEQLILWVIRDGPVEKDDLAASLAEFLEEQDLIGILASEAVRAQHGDDIDDAQLRRVA